MNMENIYALVDRYVKSLYIMEHTLNLTLSSLEKKGTPEDILSRVRSYYDILDQQFSIVATLTEHLDKADYPNILHTVHKLNSLSKFISEDARSIRSPVSITETIH